MMHMEECNNHSFAECRRQMRAIQDTMDVLSGKWKISIMSCLRFGHKRFMDMQREVEGIGPKMLSKELQDLEMNGLVKRTVLNTRPVMIEYEITEYGQTLNPIIHEMANWGVQHRERVMSPVAV